ncbi:MAG: hypothetical protein HRT47_10855 [Candidatus Caenarcaniphilales bacterium]|nr:hypothetical protein [Candidatus Caenarcaniphilales bacterium]
MSINQDSGANPETKGEFCKKSRFTRSELQELADFCLLLNRIDQKNKRKQKNDSKE